MITEEEAVRLTKVVPFLVQDMLEANAGLYHRGEDWQSFVVTDAMFAVVLQVIGL